MAKNVAKKKKKKIKLLNFSVVFFMISALLYLG